MPLKLTLAVPTTGTYCTDMLFTHKWARSLKQQLLITVYRLPTKENKLPFSVSICSKKRKFAVSVSVCSKKTEVAVFHLRNSGNIETWAWRHRVGDMETWRHRHEAWESGNMETLVHGGMDIETWTWKHEHGDLKHGRENKSNR